MEIRLMQENEVEEVKELIFKTLLKKITKEYTNNKSSFTIVATNEGSIVGVMTIFIHDDALGGEKSYFVSNLCVDSEFQRMGIATKMLDYVEDMARKEEIKYIYTLIPVKYLEANKLYEKMNYDIKNINCYRKEVC